MREARQEVSALWGELAPHAEREFTEGESLEQFKQLRGNWGLVEGAFTRLEQAYTAKDKPALTSVLEDDWPVLQKGAVKPLQALIPITQRAADADYRAAIEKSRLLLGVGLAAAVVCLVGLSSVAWLITRSLMRTLGAEPREAAAVVQGVAAGDLSAAIRLAPGDTISLMAQLKQMQQNLASTVAGVRQAADAVASVSTQIAQGNKDLSGRTESQASALQETTASMQLLGTNVTQNADNALRANQMAAGGRRGGDQGRRGRRAGGRHHEGHQ